MRRRVEIAVLAILAAAIVILVLNHLEVDEYPQGSTVDPLGDLPLWIAPTYVHDCGGSERTYPFEATECRLEVAITDRDGWYRLFWAGAETYIYDDPALVGGALRNRTAELSGGTWTIRGRLVAGEADNLSSFTAESVELRYILRRGKLPEMGAPVMDRSGTVAVPTRVLWFRYPYPPHRLDDFWWELDNPGAFEATHSTPCGCGR